MRAITKGREPQSLAQHRANTHSDYDNYADKAGLRAALVKEQGGVCCYCMGRIRDEESAMKIEHWQCQDHHPRRQLDYSNLLGACRGGMGHPRATQHCDTRKGNDELKWNPAEPAHSIEGHVCYSLADGSILSPDPEFDRQLNDVLNLNLQVMKTARLKILEEITRWWKAEKGRRRGPVPRGEVEKKLRGWMERSELVPYSGVAVWALRRRLGEG